MASPGEFIGRRVGRFTITSHLASGGMAELYIARQEAVGGFEKDLVLKMLQDRYAANPRVVGMFLDEARLAAKLNHQNIVHVYDVDQASGLHYIAMEYIHGETVTDIVRKGIARGVFLPLEHAVQIVADAAAGLAYAHERRDPDGHITRIIHRDVSPSNVLVTYEGITKIVDFGIARVQDQIREESGMRPGKVSYMSPEQARGQGADHRSDVFSLGIILYEITVGRRLWRGPPDEVLRRIQEEQIPPPTYIRREYPPALELIVMKALEKRPADRQQSAGELQHELLEFMEEAGLKSGPPRLAQYMKDLFAEDGTVPDRRADRKPEPAADVAAVAPAVPDESEELDFDRRAPLMMRVEARVDDGAASRDRRRPPVPPTVSATAGRDTGMSASRAGAAVAEAPKAASPPAKPANGAAASAHRDRTGGWGAGGGPASSPVGGTSVPPKREDDAIALDPDVDGTVGEPESARASETSGPRSGSDGHDKDANEHPNKRPKKQANKTGGVPALWWVILLVLMGTGLVVFLASR